MLILAFCFLFYCISATNAVVYESFYGNLQPLTERQIKEFENKNNTKYCTVNVKLPCDPNDWRRIDGSCNNLKYPSLGTKPFATNRALEPTFSPNYEPVKTKSGKNYPLARSLRTELLRPGKASDIWITQLVSYYILFMINDVNTIHDIFNYLLNNTKCCTPEGKTDYTCTPSYIPVDDPVHRFSGIRCMNLTRPQTYQTFGCLEPGSRFSRIMFLTPTFDLDQLYNFMPGAMERMRTFKNGLLKTELDNGKIFPVSTGPSDPIGMNNLQFGSPCTLNELPKETRCHKYLVNDIIGSNLLNIIFIRLHNVIAQKLKQMNPCWDDKRLFLTARDINIAISLQIYYYELLPVIFGRTNLIRDGVISDSDGFRDMYDENVPPLVTDEYGYVLRYFHTIQEDTMKLYDNDGYFLKTFPLVNLTSRTGILPMDNFIDQVTQGSFRQASGKFDFTIDYDMSELSLGGLQHVSDVATNDLSKGRLFGFQPYIKYREFCSRKKWTFDDLDRVMSDERIHRLSQVYEFVEDIELMAGIWAEEKYPGSRVPYTVYCLMIDQLKRFVASDRHWYERPNRPQAFTPEQLHAIRGVTIAGIMCMVGDGVTKIQPQAFYSISSVNPLLSCSSSIIGNLNLEAWQDYNCWKFN